MIDKWKKISEKIIKVGFRSFVNRNFKLPDGRVEEYTIKNEKDSVCVLAITEDKKVILFKQFRPGPEKVLLELPGGLYDGGEPIDSAKKELLEETGYIGEIKFVGKNYHCAYSTRTRYNFVATNCKKIKEQKLDKNEFGEIVLISLDDFRKHLRGGELTDVETGYMALDYLDKL